MSIKIENLDFNYGPKKVLDNINLEIKTGELTALMGLSGCGKTTLLRVLLGLNEVQSGEVEIDGIKLSQENSAQVRELISYIPQHGALFPHLKIRNNILLPIKVKRAVIAQDIEKIDELAAFCNLPLDLLNRYPSELSGGQKQRASILRALLMDTPYIFMDEPLSALDPITKISIQKEFKSIFLEQKKTIIMVTHSLGEAKYLCDKLAILNKGRIEQVDGTMNIINSPNDGFVSDFVNSQL